MPTINRSLLYITPTKKCIDWVNSHADDNFTIDYASYVQEHDNASVFLIPEFETAEEALAWLRENWQTWFDNLLFDWDTDEANWPQNRSWEMLNEFFEIRWQSLIEDTLSKPIRKQDD